MPITKFIASTLRIDINYCSFYVPSCLNKDISLNNGISRIAHPTDRPTNQKHTTIEQNKSSLIEIKTKKKWRMIFIINNIVKCLRETSGVFIVIYRNYCIEIDITSTSNDCQTVIQCPFGSKSERQSEAASKREKREFNTVCLWWNIFIFIFDE